MLILYISMKLIRLTTQDTTANFYNLFNEDIILEPFSKIALNSLTMQIITNQILIDAQNNELTFKITQNGIVKSIFLNHGIYDKTNIDDFFNDITNKLNLSLGYTQGELGKQFYVSTTNNKFVIQLQTGTIVNPVADLVVGPTNILLGSNNVNQTFALQGNPINIKRNGGVNLTNDSFCYIKSPITKGCGSMRSRIYSNTAGGGYIMALLNIPVNANMATINPANIVFGVKFEDNGVAYKIYKNGIQTTSSVLASVGTQTGGATNDLMAINVYGGIIHATVSNNADINRVNGLIIDNIAYNQIDNLYPVYIMVGENTTLQAVQVSSDPFYNNANNVSTYLENYDIGVIPSFVNNPVETYLNFLDSDLSKSLGYNNQLQQQSTVNGNLEYKADNPLVFRDIADTYLVELMNLNTDAYDSIRQQHVNLLATIPQYSLMRERLIYNATFPIFLNLNNKNKINLREIRCRVLKEDWSQVSTIGYSQITLLIDN